MKREVKGRGLKGHFRERNPFQLDTRPRCQTISVERKKRTLLKERDENGNEMDDKEQLRFDEGVE